MAISRTCITRAAFFPVLNSSIAEHSLILTCCSPPCLCCSCQLPPAPSFYGALASFPFLQCISLIIALLFFLKTLLHSTLTKPSAPFPFWSFFLFALQVIRLWMQPNCLFCASPFMDY